MSAWKRTAASSPPTLTLRTIEWQRCAAKELRLQEDRLELITGESTSTYQIMSQPIDIPAGSLLTLRLSGELREGELAAGFLDESKNTWLGYQPFGAGRFDETVAFDAMGSRKATMVISTHHGEGPIAVSFDRIEISVAPPDELSLTAGDRTAQGWNVGYSLSGEIISTGKNVTTFATGDLVACCGAGFANHAEYVSVPVNLVSRIPVGCSIKLASAAAVGAIAIHGVRRAEVQVGETVCVIGLGLIGQIAVQVLKAAGCKVFGFDPSRDRVDRAMSLGMDAGAVEAEDLKKLLRDATLRDWPMADRTIVTAATRSSDPVNLAMECTRAKGRVVLVGDVGLNLERANFYRKELDIVMSTSYGPGRYDRAYEEDGKDYPAPYVRWTLNRNMSSFMELVGAGKLNISPLIDRVVPVADAPALYGELARPESGVIGAMIVYPRDPVQHEAATAQAIRLNVPRKPADGLVRYALVGAGAFGTGMLVPQMAKRKDRFFLNGVVSRSGIAGSNFAKANRVPVLASDIDAVLADSDFDLIVIATRHHEHADMAIKSLKAGKHVFVEKPLAISWEELDAVAAAYESGRDRPLLLVGFNRRFSPAIQMLQEELRSRKSPLMMAYRVNAGFLPADSWVRGEQGGGRNIGEACHMYDVFRFLAGSSVTRIEASSVDPGTRPYSRNENFCATVSYGDGSVGNLVYTALGPGKGLPKERLEVYCDGDAFLIDDFKSLARASDGETLWESETADKGHFEELSRFGDAIANGGESPIAFEDLAETTAVSLRVEDLLFGRGGQDE